MVAPSPLIVAYHTGGPYAEEAAGLRESLDALGLEYEIDELPSAGSWRDNAHLRPGYLQGKRRQHPGRPLLSLDVDARVRSNPLPYLTSLDCDIAFHTHTQPTGRKEPLPGTLWLGVGDDQRRVNVKTFLDSWQEINRAHPGRNDRQNFAYAVHCCRMLNCAPTKIEHLRTAKLPAAYCFIFDTHRKMYPGVVPIIEHFQASRRLKDMVQLSSPSASSAKSAAHSSVGAA